MAAAAERPPLIGPWPGAWQVRRRRPGAREWAPRGWRCRGELEPGSSWRPAGRSQGLSLASLPPETGEHPSGALYPLWPNELFAARGSFPPSARRWTSSPAWSAPPQRQENVPLPRPKGADPGARTTVPLSRPISRVLLTRHCGP